jgi:WD40 repeat protein
MTQHGSDVKSVHWHPRKALIASGSKDSLVKLWDPKTGKCVFTVHGHKNTVRWRVQACTLLRGNQSPSVPYELPVNVAFRGVLLEGKTLRLTRALPFGLHLC